MQVVGLAYVTAVEPCPEIASGEGSAITGRFVTRQVDRIARIEILGADGKVETIEGTPIHPIWSEDRQDWVPLGELAEGEQLRGDTGTAIVLAATILLRPAPVYNIEVHGEHVYEVGELGLLVHNASPARCAMIAEHGADAMKGWQAAHIILKVGWSWAPKELKPIIQRLTKAGLIDDVANLFASTPGHAGTHTMKYGNCSRF